MRTPLLLLVSALLTLWPAAAGAQELSALDVSRMYSEAGWTIGEATPWSEGVTMVPIHAPAGEHAGWPTLRAFVYSKGVPLGGSQLLVGYGLPEVFDNVALVRFDPTAFPQEPDCVVEVRS